MMMMTDCNNNNNQDEDNSVHDNIADNNDLDYCKCVAHQCVHVHYEWHQNLLQDMEPL